MSEKGNRNHELLEKYEAMTTEELKQLLREDSETEGGTDTEEILYIMEVLASRNKSEDTGNRAQKVWESFQREYLSDEAVVPEKQENRKKNRSWWRPLAAVAAVLVLLVGVTVTVDAFGWVDVWDAVVNWAKETFSFVSSDQPRLGEPAPEDTREFESFHQVIAEKTGRTDLVPTVIPEGFVLTEMDFQTEDARDVYLAFYTHGEKFFRVQVQIRNDEVLEWVEKSSEAVEVYEADGTSYYIFSNNAQLTAAWTKDSYECYISGELTVEEIKMMIDSIGKG